MYRSKIIIAPIDSLEDSYHVSMMEAFKGKYPTFIGIDDIEPLMVGVIGHYCIDGVLHGEYHVYAKKSKNPVPKYTSMFCDVCLTDKVWVSIGAIALALGTWLQFV